MTSTEPSPPEQTPDWAAIVAENMPKVDAMVTENDAPINNLFCAKQQRLLVEPLYTSWTGPGEGRPFLVEANLAVFYSVHRPPLVPNVMLSLDARAPDDAWAKSKRAYFIWEYGKRPEVVIEIVTTQQSPQGEQKLHDYSWISVPFCIIFDPTGQLGAEPLRVYGLAAKEYRRIPAECLPTIGLGLRLWQGAYEGLTQTWLRWCDPAGNILQTGAECAAAAEQHAAQEHQRAEHLAAQLRALGVEPQDAGVANAGESPPAF